MGNVFGGSGRSTVSVRLPPPTALENELNQINLRVARLQEQEFGRASAERERYENSELFQVRNAMELETAQYLLARVRGETPPISEGQRLRLNTIYGEREREGEASLQRYGEEAAAARGLRLTDTPIYAEVGENQRRFQGSLQAARASSELDLGAAEGQFNTALAEFQAGLRQQAFQNRLLLAGQTSPSFGLAGQLGAARLAGAGQTTRTPQDYTNALISGGSAIASAAIMAASTVRLKRDITPLDKDEYDHALERVTATPIVRYRYIWEKDGERAPHIGPILELSPMEIREGDGTHVNLLDYSGLLHASQKALARRLGRMEKFTEALASARGPTRPAVGRP